MNVLTPTPHLAAMDPMDALLLRYFADFGAQLDIPSERWKHAKRAYEEVGQFLCDPTNPLSRYDPSVYTQGSARALTTNRPVKGDEFDIDLICELLKARGLTATQVFELVKAALEHGGKYKGRLTVHNRCIRISFPGFHLDITPGVPDFGLGPENILITDRPTARLKNSNPKGFCDDFFGRIANVPPRIRTAHPKASYFETMLEARADVEPVATPGPMRAVLVRFVQILKRHRDITCGDDKNAPISAIITTLAAHAYADLSLVEHDSLYDLLLAIAKKLPSKLGPTEWSVPAARWIHTCPNPANALENYADKWPTKPQRQDAFFAWQGKLVTYLEGLRQLRGRGHDVLTRELSAGFGQDLVQRAAIGNASATKASAAAGALGITATGALTSRAHASVAVRPQTFHGGNFPG